MSLNEAEISGTAQKLIAAHKDLAPIEPLTETYPGITIEDAYRIQLLSIDAWKAGLHMFVHNPLTGVGVDCFPYAYGSGEFSSRSSYLRPHNMYVQIIAELGIVGLLAFGAFIIYVLRENIRLRKRLRQAGHRSSVLVWLSH